MAQIKSKRMRKIALVQPLDAEGKKGIIRIMEERQVEDYLISRQSSDFGEAFTLLKCGSSDEEHSHDVCLDGEHSKCCCRAFSRWNSCRHVEGLIALKQAGRL